MKKKTTILSTTLAAGLILSPVAYANETVKTSNTTTTATTTEAKPENITAGAKYAITFEKGDALDLQKFTDTYVLIHPETADKAVVVDVKGLPTPEKTKSAKVGDKGKITLTVQSELDGKAERTDIVIDYTIGEKGALTATGGYTDKAKAVKLTFDKTVPSVKQALEITASTENTKEEVPEVTTDDKVDTKETAKDTNKEVSDAKKELVSRLDKLIAKAPKNEVWTAYFEEVKAVAEANTTEVTKESDVVFHLVDDQKDKVTLDLTKFEAVTDATKVDKGELAQLVKESTKINGEAQNTEETKQTQTTTATPQTETTKKENGNLPDTNTENNSGLFAGMAALAVAGFVGFRKLIKK